MPYFGDIRLGDTVDIKFCTVTTTGAPTTLAGSPVVSAYPGNSTTELTAGITLSVDFDSRTGLNNVRVVASNGNGYATATNYSLVITTGTVGGTSVVGYTIGDFSIENRSALMPTTAALTLDVSAGGEAGIDWANIGSKTTSNALTGTTIATTQKVDLETIKTNPVVNGGTVTFPTTATLASTSNITAATGIDVTKWTGTTVATPATAGIPEVNVKNINNVATTPVTTVKAVQGLTTADTIVTVSGNVNGSIGGSVASVTARVTANTDQLAGQTVTAAAGVTFPTSVASPTNISAGTITTVTNLTNAPTSGDFTATMKTSIGTAVAASAVASVTGDVNGSVIGAVGSVSAGGITASSIAANAITAAKIATDAITSAQLAASAVTKIQASILNDATPFPGADIALIQAKTTNIPASPAAVGDIPTAIQNADALLKRDFSSVSGEASRSALNALRFSRNKWDISAGTLTVTKEDDTTAAWTGAVTQTAGNPVSAIDPA